MIYLKFVGLSCLTHWVSHIRYTSIVLQFVTQASLRIDLQADCSAMREVEQMLNYSKIIEATFLVGSFRGEDIIITWISISPSIAYFLYVIYYENCIGCWANQICIYIYKRLRPEQPLDQSILHTTDGGDLKLGVCVLLMICMHPIRKGFRKVHFAQISSQISTLFDHRIVMRNTFSAEKWSLKVWKTYIYRRSQSVNYINIYYN